MSGDDSHSFRVPPISPTSSSVTSVAEKGSSSMLSLRRGSSKKVLKEKIVQIYEAFFRGEDASSGNANFWDELFLLRANTQYIEDELVKLSGEQLIDLKDTINMLFYQCINMLKQDSVMRCANAIQTLCALLRSVFSRPFGRCDFNAVEVLIGFDCAEQTMQTLTERINNILLSDSPTCLKSLTLGLLLVLCTLTDNVSENIMLEYIMMNSVFETIIQILGNASMRSNHGHDVVLLLTILVQYRKYESANPYIVKLSILDDELALTGYSQVVSTSLLEHNRQYRAKTMQPEGGFLSTITSMVGSMFVVEEAHIETIKANDSMLLALYEAIHLNRNFITTLTHCHSPLTPETPTMQTSPTTPVTPTGSTSDSSLQGSGSVSSGGSDSLVDSSSQPTNLLVTFLEYCSVVTQDIKDPARYCNTKLCMIILTCVVEDQYANSLMHDVNMNFRVPLHRMPMRHRKGATDRNVQSRPLASAVLDLMVEFVTSHMMKNFPMELYAKSLGITHRILCYQKKCRVRLQYPWKDLWTATINLVKFLLSNESHLIKKHDIFQLSTRVVNIFNLFITYGDTFLLNPNSYDELYYEVVRMHQVFDNLYSMALRYTNTEGQWKESALRLTNALVNIRAIVNHFSPKVESWTISQQLSSLTEQQVLEVVRNNYDSLTLKMQESLDQFERYSEKPKETAYFSQLVRSIVLEVRKTSVDTYVRSSTVQQQLLTST